MKFITVNKQTILIGLITSLAIIIFKVFDILLVYNFFSFEYYQVLVGIIFLAIGFLLARKKTTASQKPENEPDLYSVYTTLTNREILIFRLLSEGKTNKEIAEHLNVALSTIKTHTNNLYGKINVKSRIEAREAWMTYMQK